MSSDFSTKVLYAFLISPMHTTYLTTLIHTSFKHHNIGWWLWTFTNRFWGLSLEGIVVETNFVTDWTCLKHKVNFTVREIPILLLLVLLSGWYVSTACRIMYIMACIESWYVKRHDGLNIMSTGTEEKKYSKVMKVILHFWEIVCSKCLRMQSYSCLMKAGRHQAACMCKC